MKCLSGIAMIQWMKFKKKVA